MTTTDADEPLLQVGFDYEVTIRIEVYSDKEVENEDNNLREDKW